MRLDVDICRERLGAARHAYLATTGADGVPHLVPVTFALVGTPTDRPDGAAPGDETPGDEIVVVVDHKPKTTRELRRLRNVAENPRAAVLADRYDDDWSRLWWVRADGAASVEHTGVAWERAVDALAARYPQYRERRPDGPVLRVRVSRWSGWAHDPLFETEPASF